MTAIVPPVADNRTPEQIQAAEDLRVAEEAEREQLIADKKIADIEAHAADTDRLLEQYEVHRRDQAENDPYSIHYGGCAVMVLDLDHDPLAVIAAEAYADACQESHPAFAAALRRVIDGDR